VFSCRLSGQSWLQGRSSTAAHAGDERRGILGLSSLSSGWSALRPAPASLSLSAVVLESRSGFCCGLGRRSIAGVRLAEDRVQV